PPRARRSRNRAAASASRASAPAMPARPPRTRPPARSTARSARRRAACSTGSSDIPFHSRTQVIDMRPSNYRFAPAVLALALAACGTDSTPEQQRQEVVADVQDTVDRLGNLSSDPDEAAAELQALGREMEERLARAK